MKYLKILLILLIFLAPVSYAQEPEFIKELRGHLEYNDFDEDYNPNNIYLEPESQKFINITQPQSISSKNLKIKKSDFEIFESKKGNFSQFQKQEHSIASQYGEVSKQIGNFSFGTEYDSFLDDGEINYMTGVFTRYDWKRAAITLTARTETGNNFSYYNDKIVIAPELKLTKHLSLLDIAQTDVKQTSQKNEVVLRYKRDLKKQNKDLIFELRAGQTFREQDYVKSSLRFSTRVNF